MDKIKFGTDGWRAVIAKDFIVDNVSKVAYAIAQWLTKKYKQPSAVVGYDCRFGGEMFSEVVAKILASKGIRVYVPEHFVTTPMVSLGIRKIKANCGIIITASHNAAEYNGLKLRGDFGGPMLDKDIREIEHLINESYDIDLDILSWNHMLEQGLIQYINLEVIYIKQIKDNFDLDKIKKASKKFAFDAMYGSSQNVFRKLLPDVKLFHCEYNPTFKGIPPEPAHKNLFELSEYMWNSKEALSGFAVDGDGDRISMYDNEGNFIDAHHIILLLIHYMAGYNKMTGKVVVTYSVTSKIEKLCEHYGLGIERVRIGFKEITRLMVNEDVLIGGEESGGIAFKSHLPERDGIWTGLTIWQWLLETGKSLKELINEIYSITGTFYCERMDIGLNKNVRSKVMEKCGEGEFTSFGRFNVQNTENIDGYKLHFSGTQSVMIRLSGTEPVLRLYAEGENKEVVRDILSSVENVIKRL